MLVGSSVFNASAYGSDNASAASADATLTVPAGTSAGDFMLMFLGSDSSLNHAPLSSGGWTLYDYREDYGADGQSAYVVYRYATASEPASYLLSNVSPDGECGDGNCAFQVLLRVYRGVNATAPINAFQVVVDSTKTTNSADITTATAAITTTVANCLAICGLSPDVYFADAPTITAWPAGFTQNQFSVINPPTPYPFGWANIYSAEQDLPAAGSLPGSAFQFHLNYGGTVFGGSMSFVLALAPD